LARIAVVDPDADHRPRLAARLRDAGYSVVATHASADEAWATDADAVVVATSGDLIDQLSELRLNLGQSVPLVVGVEEADLQRLDEITSVGIAGLVVGHDVEEMVEAVAAVLGGEGFIGRQAMGLVLDEIARLRIRDQERNLELEDLVRRLQDLSVNDGLTGLKKHGYFFERLDDELGRALRHRRSVAVVLCEIDDFAAVVETRGRRASDAVLQEVADVITEGLRTGDVLSRLGAEEFALLLPETDPTGAVLVADRVREQVSALVIPEVGRVTVSVGVASAPENAVDRDSLIEAAERALYLARREGRNRTRTAGDGAVVGVPLHSASGRGGRNRVVDLLVRVLKMRDPRLADHAIGTADVAVALGAQVGMTTERLDHLRVAALLQDVGKIGVPDSILHKRGRLTPEEWEVIQDHPKKGFELVGGIIHPEAAEAVLNNHERYDGLGYPRGIGGDDIPELARVLLVADAYVAMTMDRSFKAPMSPSDALAELRRNAGSQFDPDVVEAMTELAANTDLNNIGSGGGLRFVAGSLGPTA
jgi:diguanylate cyclase (GGDEF)-like protein